MARIGFLGLGIMGRAMAANLLKAGFEVTVWNRSAAKCAPLVAQGAAQAATPREVVEACDFTIAILADPAAARETVFTADGVLAGMSAGKGYIDMSTVDDATAREIAAAIASKGGRFLEAPVSGTKKPAEDGTLVILAAGDQSLYDEAGPAFDKLGKKRVFLGDVGQGARMKLVVNMIMGSMMVALSEGLALGLKGNLDGAKILEVIEAGAMACPMFKGKGPMLLNDDASTSFPLKHMQKDLRLALALSEELGQSLQAASAANEVFKRANIAGHGDDDIAAVYRVVR
ncbi:NAD(P)-dependent oxidoreductase [Uliginosibacterium sp. 31-12]|uniref:NAD(P)-dependent oxidoreductase n=1 Tax=Uliginosibacterium sp. 31-12 TaxID=3062781 RepID=UPI0026E3E8DB|nr:NAD(P)-dependent oxidoreductase [Uliginosibacterium sp. 31-12]MDO6387688.1 NAD(P)-dependent oxidoreductase [Uliginosibacterium sp. 31-12]